MCAAPARRYGYAAAHLHSAVLTGLEPQGQYFYQAGFRSAAPAWEQGREGYTQGVRRCREEAARTTAARRAAAAGLHCSLLVCCNPPLPCRRSRAGGPWSSPHPCRLAPTTPSASSFSGTWGRGTTGRPSPPGERRRAVPCRAALCRAVPRCVALCLHGVVGTGLRRGSQLRLWAPVACLPALGIAWHLPSLLPTRRPPPPPLPPCLQRPSHRGAAAEGAPGGGRAGPAHRRHQLRQRGGGGACGWAQRGCAAPRAHCRLTPQPLPWVVAWPWA